MKVNLNQSQRIIAAIIYLILLSLVFTLIGGNFIQLFSEAGIDSSIWFYSGALLIVLGAYIAEPFFSKPTDVIANSVAVIIALLCLQDKDAFLFYPYVFGFSLFILLSSIISIALKDRKSNLLRKTSKVLYWISVNFGHNKVIFSTVFLSAAISYFAFKDNIIVFICILAFWICVIFFDVVGKLIEILAKIPLLVKSKTNHELGQSIGCDNPFLYKVEIDYSKHKRIDYGIGEVVAVERKMNVGSMGLIISKKQLLNKEWLSIYLLTDIDRNCIEIDIRTMKLFTENKSIFSQENLAYKIEFSKIDEHVRTIIESNFFYKKRKNFIGYVEKDSNINTINFSVLDDSPEKELHEGLIVETPIYGEETLYQIINGTNKKEHLENYDSYGFTIGIARKLGKYDITEKELLTRKWMPEIYAPVFLKKNPALADEQLKEISYNAIGRLPETDYIVPIKDLNSIVTHNTAILGILGIGKSCLAYELIKKISESGIKVICIDITNEYYSDKGLFAYKSKDDIVFDIPEQYKQELKRVKDIIVEKDPIKSGNEDLYRKYLDQAIADFCRSDKKILIINPDIHPVAQGQKMGYTVYTVDLTPAEKTRIISERLFLYALKAGPSNTARYLIVYEEAHSLIPEWNSAANEGDRNAANGTARVILQGRKYGLGCMVITQRTANISKSILNQCNTIFAMRIFDDTGKMFLENYIGQDYSNTLPTLEERHAIAIGKGLKLKQPVIIQLNDKKHFIEAPLIETANDQG